ncbi:triacylglycerol lipase OBL1-like, partial [Raphanus sativus]|uniref:Triacylglycerol lipase OBL1-like n=1 Tax=Raphanus sativus TaxID=3726 RepID=A0A9W3CXD7_RAPSA
MYQTDMKFCSSYFLVDPTKASVLDLLLLLFFPNLTNTGFIDSPPDTLKSVRRTFASRWIIVLAVLVQKILMLLREPFASVGRFLTYWPNLLTANGGFFKLILHILTGKLVQPEESSATYVSFVGCTDRRVELDKKISVGTIEYKSMLSIMASKMDFVSYYDFYN